MRLRPGGIGAEAALCLFAVFASCCVGCNEASAALQESQINDLCLEQRQR